MSAKEWLASILFGATPKATPPLDMCKGWRWEKRAVEGFMVVHIDVASGVQVEQPLVAWHLVSARGKAWAMLPRLSRVPGLVVTNCN